MNNFELFMEKYTKNLEKVVKENPNEYRWPITDIFIVSEKMKKALQDGSYSIQSDAIRLTCKELNIKLTYKALNEFLKG